MKNQEEHQKMRDSLMDGTIKAVSIYGLSGLTTRNITSMVNMNEAYIYRYFLDKDDLLLKTFERTEKVILQGYADIHKECFKKDGDIKQCMQDLFLKCFDYMLSVGDLSKFIIRYIYSPYFSGRALEIHNENGKKLINIFSKIFKDGTDVKFICHNMIMTLLSYTNEILNGSMENNLENKKKVFEVSYRCYCDDIDLEKIKKL